MNVLDGLRLPVTEFMSGVPAIVGFATSNFAFIKTMSWHVRE